MNFFSEVVIRYILSAVAFSSFVGLIFMVIDVWRNYLRDLERRKNELKEFYRNNGVIYYFSRFRR